MRQRQKQKLRQLEQALAEASAPSIPADPVEFCTRILGFQPTPYQTDLIRKFQTSQFTAARWCRQSGKTQTVAAILLHYALINPNTCIGIVGPSWRQTKHVIRRINTLLKRLPKSLYEKPQQTAVRLKNGSIIEAFPNNPETIRGPTLHVVYADEFNFIPNDKDLYDAILFTLSATNGKFICTSTPWHTDSIFWRIWHDPAYSDYAKSHITHQQATEPNGPLKREILQKIRRQLENDQWRWRREMVAEWAEDQNTWLTQSLIIACIDPTLEYASFHEPLQGELYAGLDLGKHQDPTALAVLKTEENALKLVHMHRFPLKTPYATVIGYVKTLCGRWNTIRKILVDMTGVGEYILEDMQNTGIHAAEGIKFTQETKEQLANNLKQLMTEKRLKIPYDPELIAELNAERYQLTKEGRIRLTHPEGTHDDRFWSLALAAYAAKTVQPTPNLWVVQK
ncbi:MAG: terminase family protein [Candidatus Bathyarchaeota archaeon]|nr:terminase family protein [Candidatus Bathyarchaeota archaeon]